ncbi:MAG: hypothetical protein R3B48_24745 [Kofleriaceae bacterium]
MSWTRRQWLQYAGVATGSALLSTACGGAPRAGRAAAEDVSGEEVRGWLRQAAAEAAKRWGAVRGVALLHEHVAARVDVAGAASGAARLAEVALRARDARGRALEVRTLGLERDAILQLPARLAQLAGASAAAAPATAALPGGRSDGLWRQDALARDPLARAPERLRQVTQELAERADRFGSSRVVYRGAGVDLDFTTAWYVDDAGVYEQQLRRRRQAIAVVASTSTRPIGAEVAAGWARWRVREPSARATDAASNAPDAPDAPDPLRAPSDDAIAGAVERVLRLTTPSPLRAGAYDVVLDPSVAETILRALARALRAPALRGAVKRWNARRRVGRDGAWRLRSNVSAPGAYGGAPPGRGGAPAADAVLLRDGVLVVPSREPSDAGDELDGAPAHLEVDAPRRPLADLLGEVAAGFSVEGGLDASVDLLEDEFTARAQVARELARGTYSGRAFAQIELRGSLSALIDSIRGWSTEADHLSRRELRDGWPRFRSATIPWSLCRATLRQGAWP